jgi:hypothetical protein
MPSPLRSGKPLNCSHQPLPITALLKGYSFESAKEAKTAALKEVVGKDMQKYEH